MRHRAAGAFVLVLMTAIARPGVRASGCEPELIAVNGRIYTVDAAAPWVEALAVCNGRIVQTGPTREIEPLAGKSTRRIDLAGRTVLPGFNDSHVHLIDGGTQLVEVNLRDARTPEETAARLAAFVKTQRKGRWILGGFWDHEAWPEKVLPTRALIDPATPDNPVFIQRIDGHMGLANSLALKLAGITAQTATPDGGAIVKDAQGEPTGMLKDNAMTLVMHAVPPPKLEETVEKARAALRHAASVGVTTIQDMTASAAELKAYQVLRAEGQLPVRITSHQNHGIQGLVAAGVSTGFGDDWLRIGGIKLFADGAMGSGTAAFLCRVHR
jgi:predicted amidohydrolase YtcJ